MRFYKNGKCIGERFCEVCKRPATYSEVIISIKRRLGLTEDEHKAICRGAVSAGKGKQHYYCGYHLKRFLN